MEGMPFTYDISGNNNGGNWWGSIIGGAVGGAIGAGAFGNRNGGCCNNGCCSVQGDSFIMDNLTSLNNNVNSIGRDNLMQSCSIGRDLAVGQSRTEAAVYTSALQGQLGQKDNVIATLNAAHNAEVQGMRNTFDIVSSQKDCCCATQRLIEQTGCRLETAIANQTRAVLDRIDLRDREELQRRLCKAEAKNAQLEMTQTNAVLARETYLQSRQDLRDSTQLLLAALRNSTEPTGGTTTTA